MNPKILAVANQKGGVGKTSTAINLAAGLAAHQQRTLVVDLDPQCNASTGMGLDSKDRKTCYHVLSEALDATQAILPSQLPRMDVLPASGDLYGIDMEFATASGRETLLRDALSSLNYDVIILDCPPSLGLLTVNALVAAQAVLIPLQCEFFALEGLTSMIKTIERVQHNFNPKLAICGIVLTMHDIRNNLTLSVEQDVRGYFESLVFQTTIPRNIRISEAQSHGQPVLTYDFACRGAQAYLALAKEFLAHHNGEPS